MPLRHLCCLPVAVLVLSLPGCTFLNQGDPRIIVKLAMPEMPTEEIGGGRRVAVAASFADERSSRDHCGIQKITYGMTPGIYECSAPPAAELARLLAERLKAQGFDVLPAAGVVPATALRIEGELLHFFVEPVKPNGESEADLHLRLRASSGTGLAAEREFYVKGRSRETQRALTSGLRKMLSATTEAVAELLEREPTVGRPLRTSRGPIDSLD